MSRSYLWNFEAQIYIEVNENILINEIHKNTEPLDHIFSGWKHMVKNILSWDLYLGSRV